MLLGRKKKAFEKEQKQYLSCTGVWYFKVEYFEDWADSPSYMYFESIRDAEHWYKHTNHISMIVCLTDRQGNRIITDWTGYAGAGTVDVWTNCMGRQVLDLREGRNNLWVPKDSRQAKNAQEKSEI